MQNNTKSFLQRFETSKEGTTGSTISGEFFAVHSFKTFIYQVKAFPKPSILDLGALCSANLEYFLQYGIKVYVYDVLREVHESIKRNPKIQSASIAMKLIEEFPIAEQNFDGILIWHTLDYLSDLIFPIVFSKALSRLRPSGLLYAFFLDKTRSDTYERIRIANLNQMETEPYSLLSCKKQRTFSNKMIYDLFLGHEVKAFFMTKTGIREVLVTKKHSAQANMNR